jgi:hypothetical protein
MCELVSEFLGGTLDKKGIRRARHRSWYDERDSFVVLDALSRFVGSDVAGCSKTAKIRVRYRAEILASELDKLSWIGLVFTLLHPLCNLDSVHCVYLYSVKLPCLSGSSEFSLNLCFYNHM